MNIFKYSARNLTSVQKSGIIPFVTTYHPAVKNLKQLLMQEWSLIHNQPMLKNIYKTPPFISYRRGKSLKDILVRAKLWRHISQRRNRKDKWGIQSRSVMIFSQQSLNCVKFRTKSASFPFESSRPPCLIFLGIWNTADFVSGLEMSKISGDGGIWDQGSTAKKGWDPGSQPRDLGSAVFFIGSRIRRSGSTKFCGIRDQNSHQVWNQGSKIWVKLRDQRWKNIPRYDPEFKFCV